jgi:hypothetical protein
VARSVPPWLWAFLIRDHAPRNSSVRHVLRALRDFMDKAGYTYIGQDAIVTSTCLSRPTVTRALAAAWAQQWIGVSLHHPGGRQWRHYAYRACIPDELTIAGDRHDAMVDAWNKEHGPVDTITHPDLNRVGSKVAHVGISKSRSEVGSKVTHVDSSEVGKSTSKVAKDRPRGGQIASREVAKNRPPNSDSELRSELRYRTPGRGTVRSGATGPPPGPINIGSKSNGKSRTPGTEPAARCEPAARMPSQAAIETELARNPAVGRAELLSNWFDYAWPIKNMADVDGSFAKWCARHEPRPRSISKPVRS